MKVGITGLPYSGKTSLFEAVTGIHGAVVEHSTAAHSATVPVPDPRLDRLAERGSPKKVTRALVDFVDVAGVASDQDRAQIVNTLASLHDVDGLIEVIRFFDDPNEPPHPRGSLDPLRDAADMRAEFIVSDLDIVERRMEKLTRNIAKHMPTMEQDQHELSLMQRLSKALEEGKRLQDIGLTQEESRMLRSYQFLTEKAMVTALNVPEDDLSSPAVKKATEGLGPNTVVISARIEKEIGELEPSERQEFLTGLGLEEPAASRIIRACYDALGLRSFFTGTGPGEELRAWTFHAGDNALTAAGKIHSDIARGFIRAEVVSYDDFVACGSYKDARAANKARLEGKDYPVQDGDVILFRFKV